MFQNNAVSGALFVLGILYNSWLLALGAIVGAIVSTVTAKLLKYGEEDIENGLYGFNGTLIGLAILYFFKITISILIIGLIASVFSTFMMYYLRKIIPPFTTPFIVITWVCIFIIHTLLKIEYQHTFFYSGASANLISAFSMGFGQIMFQENMVTGFIFIGAILVNSRLLALYAFYAACLGIIIGLLLSQPISNINIGLMSYNSILCALALGDKKYSALIWISLATFIAVFITILLKNEQLIALTAPFVLSTWLVNSIRKRVKIIQNK